MPLPLPPQEQEAVAAGKCRLAPYGCDGERHGALYCGAHHTRVARDGDPGDPVIRRRKRRIGPRVAAARRKCSVDGCEEPHHAKGYCGAHYSRFKLTGHPGTTPINKRGKWRQALPRDAGETALPPSREDGNRLVAEPDAILQHQPAPRTATDPAPRRRGRRPAFDEEGLQRVRRLLADPDITMKQAASLLGVSRSTLYRNLGRVSQED